MDEPSKQSVAQAVGAAGVVAGVVLMNTMDHAGIASTPAVLASAGVFVAGWVSFASGAVVKTYGEVRRVAVVGLSAVIAVSTYVLLGDMRAGRAPSPVGVLGHLAGWAGLALVMGSAKGRYLKPVAGAAAAAGGMSLLPWQRQAKLVGGPAMPLLTLGWALVATSLK